MGRRRKIGIWIASVTVLALFLACSEPARYRVLSFFFDGVPEPGGPREVARGSSRAEDLHERLELRPARVRKEMHGHAPYKDGRCRDCHNPNDGLLIRSLAAGLCQMCHEQIPGDVLYQHGPAAVNACLCCHSPHESEHEHLLLSEPESICLDCHGPGQLTQRPEHDETLTKGNCLDCHDPHGSDDPFFLRSSGL